MLQWTAVSIPPGATRQVAGAKDRGAQIEPRG